MNLCPSCGTKDFSAEHRGTFQSQPCSNCGGKMKSNPLLDKDKAMTSPKMPKKMLAKKMPKVGKAKKHDPMYGC